MTETFEVRPDDLDLSDTQKETPPEVDGGGEGDVEIVVEGQETREGEREEAGAETGVGEKTETPGRTLDEENRELKRQLLEIGNSLRELRTQRETPAAPPAAPVDSGTQAITPEQVAGLIKEHGHDPEAMARIIDFVTEQKARQVAMGIRDETMKDVNYRQWYQEHKRTGDRIVTPIYESNPEVRDAVAAAVKGLGFEGHPLGELAVVAMMEMAKTEKARESAEATRTEDITKKKSLDKTRGQAVKKIGLTRNQLDVAQKLGLDPKTYAKYLGLDTGTQVEGRV